jgi:xanthine/uracil/vitamin C permease (AzgA family)
MATDQKPAGPKAGADGFLDNYFGLTANGTNVKTEALAGLTTFLTMAYIIFVNPSILAKREWTRARYSSPPASRLPCAAS